MSVVSLQDLSNRVADAVREYNDVADKQDQINAVTLFGSYADGSATEQFDVDLLVTFRSSVVSLLTLARALTVMEKHLDKNVDLVQGPLPDDALLNIRKVVPLYGL